MTHKAKDDRSKMEISVHLRPDVSLTIAATIRTLAHAEAMIRILEINKQFLPETTALLAALDQGERG